MKTKWLCLLILPLALFAILRWQVRLNATRQVVAEVNRVSDALIASNDDLAHFDDEVDHALIQRCMTRGADLNLLPDRGADLFKRAFILSGDLLKLLQANGTPVDPDTQLFLTIRDAMSENRNRSVNFDENNKYAARLKSLLHQGVNPNARDFSGVPVLFWTEGLRSDLQKPIIDTLIGAGADINVKNNIGFTTERGFTLLIAAVSHIDSDLIELLLARHADVFVKSDRGETILTIAPTRTLSSAVLRHIYAEAHRQKLALLHSKVTLRDDQK